jgi:Membrane domain of glycerophosphoryl diester phosphodiesterase
MELALRPMSTAQVLDRTFYIYRNNFVLLAGIGALLPAMVLIMELAFIPLGIPPRASDKLAPQALAMSFLGYFFCYGVIYLLGNALTAGATVFGVSKLHLGERVTIGESYQRVFSRFWRVLGVVVVLALIVFGALIVGELIAIFVFVFSAGFGALARGGGGFFSARIILALLWAIAIFLTGVFISLFFLSKLSLAVPACILEQQPVGAALRRSWRLTKNSVGRIMLVYILTWILSVVLAIALGMPGQLYGGSAAHKAFVVGVILQGIGGFIAGVVANPIATIAVALIYYDQRVRQEAFDLQVMMEAVGQQAQAQAAAATPPALG